MPAQAGWSALKAAKLDSLRGVFRFGNNKTPIQNAYAADCKI